MGENTDSKVNLRSVLSEAALSGVGTESLATRDLGRDDAGGAGEDDEGQDERFVTFATPDNVRSFTQEFIVTVVNVYDGVDDFVPVVYLSTPEGLQLGWWDWRDPDDREIVELLVGG